ncbi:MAG: putative oxidoreductase YdgJ [Planctomycetes bacterium ADurb.Bin401]|nr:MAG: putative oxidoreductase YdgJ [Planctomycetes bacterium ADurb.Bin401]
MDKVRIGLIGYGNMGRNHAKYLFAGEVPHGELTAVCDISADNCCRARQELGGDGKVLCFDDPMKMMKSKAIDGVLIVSPHYEHPKMIEAALKNDLHVLCEKPIGVFTKNVREINALADRSKKVFGIMFNQRTNKVYQKIKEMITSGQLGEIKRTNWIVTHWYRPQSYYESGGWRATWAGEGGGVLLNQSPHQIDLWQWICGMPVRVRAFCSFGKYHDIEVEDDVTAYVEYANGATGVFITTTGETPGTNRFEIAGDNGKIVLEDEKITFWKTSVPERQFNREFKGGFGAPECQKKEVAVEGKGEEHKGVVKDWVHAILTGTPLLAPGEEGINSLQLSNAMLLSTWLDDWVNLPIDDEIFYQQLQEKINNSKFKKIINKIEMDTEGTY